MLQRERHTRMTTPNDFVPAFNELLSRQNDARLIGQVLDGRTELFADLLHPHLPGLFRLVRARMRDDPDAEDLIQQTVLKALTKLEQFRDEASFRTWLTKIAVNEVRQWQRKRVTSRLVSIDQAPLIYVSVVDPAASPFQECERRETVRSLQTALAKLPAPYRRMIHLRDVQQLSIAETAGLLHASIPTVKTRHRRARLQMAHLLGPLRPALAF